MWITLIISLQSSWYTPATQARLQTKFTPSGQWHSLTAVASTSQTAQGWPEEHDKKLKASTWPPDSPDLASVGRKSDVWRPHRGSDLALTLWDMDAGCLGVSCGAWHQGVGRSFESCRLPGGASMDLTCCSTSHGWLIGCWAERVNKQT